MPFADCSPETRAKPAGCPADYVVLPLSEQLTILRECFPELPHTGQYHHSILSRRRGADGWFMIPDWKTVADTYQEATNLALSLLSARHGLRDWIRSRERRGVLLPIRRTEARLGLIRTRQDGPFLTFPAQLGRRYRMYAPKDMHWFALERDEFCLGAFAVACMLLTHPRRLYDAKHLWIDCPGDQSMMAGRIQRAVPCFSCTDAGLHFDLTASRIGGPMSGSATGFVP